MPDSYTEVTSKSWFGRIGESIKGMFAGILFMVIAVILLFWNEGRAIKTLSSLEEGEKAVIHVASDSVNPANEGKLIHLTGVATTEETLTDSQFPVSAKAIRLKREALMYQWKEKSNSSTKKKIGGGEETTTTYSYDKEWSETPIDSSAFKHPEGHENPSSMPFHTEVLNAGAVTLGAFVLGEGLISKMDSFEPFPVRETEGNDSVQAYGGGFYSGKDPKSPQIGDVKVSFSIVKPGTVSLIAAQKGTGLEGYPTKAGRILELLEKGEVSAPLMFENAKRENSLLTWGLRLGGFILMLFGMLFLLKPLSTLTDIIPFFGSIVGFGTGLVAFMVSFSLSLAVIAVAWFVFRPLLSIGLLIVASGAFFFLYTRKKK